MFTTYAPSLLTVLSIKCNLLTGIIKMPLYWFLLLLIVLTMSFFEIFYLLKQRAQLKNLKKKERSKNSLTIENCPCKNDLKTISHDMISPLKFMVLITKELQNSLLVGDIHKSKDYADTLLNSTTNLFCSTTNLMELLKEDFNRQNEHNLYSINTLINKEIAFYTDMAAIKNNKIEYNYSSEILIPIDRKTISLITRNLLDNAIKNTSNGKIVCKTYTENKSLILEIDDNGKGMSTEMIEYYLQIQNNPINTMLNKKYGIGIHLIIELLKPLGGKIYFKKNIKGTNTQVIIPL